MNKYKILFIIGIAAYTSLVARENPFAKAYDTQERQEEIGTEGVKTNILEKEKNIVAPKISTPETKTLSTIEKEMDIIEKKDPSELKNNENNNQYIDGSPITEAVWEKLEKKQQKEEPKKIQPKETKTTSTPLWEEREANKTKASPEAIWVGSNIPHQSNNTPQETIITPIQEVKTTVKRVNNDPSVLPIRKSYPIPNSEIKYSTPTKIVKTKKQIVKKPRLKKQKRSKIKKDLYHTAFKNSAVTVQYANKSVKIITKNQYIKKRYFKNPRRVSFDFKKDGFFKSGDKNIQKKYANRIRVGAHGKFFRVTLNLKNKNQAIAHTRPYGLLINFK